MSRVRLTDQAEADICGIWHYVGVTNANPAAVDRQVARLYDKLCLLATQPLMGQLREDLRPGLRVFATGKYVILYYPMKDGIEVVGVVHGAQDIDSIFSTGDR